MKAQLNKQPKSSQSKTDGPPNAATPPARVVVNYGSQVSPAAALKLVAQPVHTPTVSPDYTRNLAFAKGAAGEADIRNYHERLFNEHNAELMTKCQHMLKHLAGEAEGIARHLLELSQIIQKTDRYQELNDTTEPWTKFEVAKAVGFGLLSVLMLLVGMNSIAQVLLASGIPGFESPGRAYLFSFVPVGLALLFKLPRTLLTTRGARKAYTWLVFSGAFVFGVCWVIEFARTFPGMTQSVADIINSLGRPSRSSSDHTLIVVSILAEALIAASCWITIEVIVEKHEPPARIESGAYAQAQADLDRWQQHRFELEQVSAELLGKTQAIEQARLRFVEEAAAGFYAALREASTRK
jgi:hypothetical protein